jgi:hypothetical protein
VFFFSRKEFIAIQVRQCVLTTIMTKILWSRIIVVDVIFLLLSIDLTYVK